MADLPNLANLDYLDRVNRAIDHITRNLGRPLLLEDVAQVACFSPFHFHRIFRSIVGETLAAFVKRLRLERSIMLLSHRPQSSLTEIALECGFSSSSDFSRSFRARFGVPPRVFDVEHFRKSNREGLRDQRGATLTKLPQGENPDDFTPRLVELPAQRVAYMRAFEPYSGDGVREAITSLLQWAEARNLEAGQWLGYQWDDPEVVDLEQCRYDVGIVVGESVRIDEGPSETRFPPMVVAEIDIAGGIELEMRALDFLFATWLPTSGYVPDQQPLFEAWNGLPLAHGPEHFELRVQMPVEKATSVR